MRKLFNSLKKCLAKMLLDLGTTGKFISEVMAAAFKMLVHEDDDFHELALANGTIVLTTGYVQFVMKCGDYKSKIVARVFPNLHKKCILGITWLEYKSPIID